MVNITYRYKSPKAVQVDSWTCGYRALFAVTNPDDQFQPPTVKKIKQAIIEARRENEQRKNSQKPAAALGTTSNNLTDESLQKMAALLAQRCHLLKSPQSEKVGKLLGDMYVVPQDEDWKEIYDGLTGNDNFKSILTWLQQNQDFLMKFGVTTFANFREFSSSDSGTTEQIFCEKHHKEIKAFCDRFANDNSSQIRLASLPSLLTVSDQVNDDAYWLQDNDIRQWCTKYNRDHGLDHFSAHIATIGSEGSRLENVFQEMRGIFNNSDRQKQETRYFVINNSIGSDPGNHWTLLKVDVDVSNHVAVTYTDSMYETDQSQMRQYVNEAIDRAWVDANQSSTKGVFNYNTDDSISTTLFRRPKSPMLVIQTEPEVLKKFQETFKRSLRSGDDLTDSRFSEIVDNYHGVSFNYQYLEPTPENSSDTSSTHSGVTDEVSDSGSDASSVTSETKTKTVGIIAKPTRQGETFSVAPSSQSQLAKPIDQMACLMQMVLEKHCLLEGKEALDLTIPEQFIDTPVTSKWILEQIQSLNSRVGDKKLSKDLKITVNDTVMVENGEAKAFTATL